MTLSIFLAKIIGMTYIVVGFSALINFSFYKKLIPDLVKSRIAMFVVSLIGLPAFFIWVFKHNVWQGWLILITLFGWIGFLKCVTILLFPVWLERMALAFLKWVNIQAWWGGFGLLVGLLFCYFGWMA